METRKVESHSEKPDLIGTTPPEGVLAPWRALNRGKLLYMDALTQGKQMTAGAVTEGFFAPDSDNQHPPQDAAAVRVLEIDALPGYSGLGKKHDIGLLAVADGATSIMTAPGEYGSGESKVIPGYRSGKVAEITVTSPVEDIAAKIDTAVGTEVLTKLATADYADADVAIDLVRAELIEPAMVHLQNDLEREDHKWQQNSGVYTGDKPEYAVDRDAANMNKLRNGRLPGGATSVVGVVLPRPDATEAGTHYAYLYGVAGKQDAGEVLLLRDGKYTHLDTPFSDRRQFMRAGNMVSDLDIPGVRIPLRPGDTIIITTDGYKGYMGDRRAKSSRSESIRDDLMHIGSQDDKTFVCLTVPKLKQKTGA
jgi:hypothetical protein